MSDMTVRECWDSIPEYLKPQIYEFVGEGADPSKETRLYGLCPVMPHFFEKLNEEQQILVKFLRRTAFNEWRRDTNSGIVFLNLIGTEE